MFVNPFGHYSLGTRLNIYIIILSKSFNNQGGRHPWDSMQK